MPAILIAYFIRCYENSPPKVGKNIEFSKFISLLAKVFLTLLTFPNSHDVFFE